MFEAVANSIHSIEDAGQESNGRISIRIIRDGQASLDPGPNERPGPEPKSDILDFVITDNGIGFTDSNLESFQTLDSDYKADRGGRGVGRLLWLKAFSRVIIESTYVSDTGTPHQRSFTFTAKDDVSKVERGEVPGKSRKTIVTLSNFAERYRDAAPKTVRSIARGLLEHCLWYFIREGGAPVIEVYDDEESIELGLLFEEYMHSSSFLETVEIKDVSFDLVHVKLSALVSRGHSISYCAANRLVKQESLRGKIPGLYGNISDSNGEFVYECYVSSDFLDDRVRSERTDFDIDEVVESLFEATEISQRDIQEAVEERAQDYLREFLEAQEKRAKERIQSFVANKAPRYRPILSRIPSNELSVDPEISDKDLDLHLHRQLVEIEAGMLAEGHDVMKPGLDEDFDTYRSRLDSYLSTAEDLKRADLANYVSHRKVIIDLLDMAIRRKGDGRYEREDLVHTLIMPMRVESQDAPLERSNLWLVDERLAFHDYLASDKSLSSIPITGSESGKEPDLVALRVFDNPVLVSEGASLPPEALTIIELKRPMRNDISAGEDKDPIEQALGYLERIRAGKVKTANGRLIPGSENVPGFCYVLCDLTPSMVQRCRMKDAIRTSDGLGYFFYHKEFNAYVEIISFDRLVNAAKERNRAFFDKLGLPTN